MVEINSEDDIQNWLQGRPQRIAIVTAFRSAMRVSPLYLVFQKEPDDEKQWARNLRLAGLRAMLISGVASECPPLKVTEKLSSAANAAYSDARSSLSKDSSAYSAIFTARSAARAARSAYSASFFTTRSVVFSAVSSDFGALQETQEDNTSLLINALFRMPVWPDGGQPLQAEYENFISVAREKSSPWNFWADWVESIWYGRPKFPRNMLEEIALIENAYWEGDDAPEKIAARIQEIIDAHNKDARQQDVYNSAETARGPNIDPAQQKKIIELTNIDREVRPKADGTSFEF